MIEKLKEHDVIDPKTGNVIGKIGCDLREIIDKLNEVIDAVNELHEEAENNARIRANHENLIDTLVAENNIHERQIDELQAQVAILEEHAHPTAKTPDYDDTDDIAEVKNENLYTKSMRMDKEFTEEEMERLQKELARTKNQLEIAVDALKLFCGEDVSYYSQSKIDARDARTALEQITALEQKDVK